MISRFISGIFLLAVIGLFLHVPGVSQEAHALVRDGLNLASTVLNGLQKALNKS